ncbi:MAG TPA: PQQ-dependent sugar dehydrogenase [Acidimicrobiales bacterium]
MIAGTATGALLIAVVIGVDGTGEDRVAAVDSSATTTIVPPTSDAPTTTGVPSTTEASTTTGVPPTSDAPTTTGVTSTTEASTTTELATASVKLTTIADRDSALDVAVRPGDPTLYVVFQDGMVGAVSGSGISGVLDIRSLVRHQNEQGLLGAAFHPSGDRLYVHYSNTSGNTRIDEYDWAAGKAVPASRRNVLAADQPFSNHNGGKITFGPDGYLYVALGDGGSGGDPGDRAQSLDTVLGKLLRIDPATPSGSLGYTIPADNPFVGQPGARGEIWAYGLRNPFKFSFDSATGDLWIGDVGQSRREEIDYAPAPGGKGANYGWNRWEGDERFSGSGPDNHHGPIWTYANSGANCAVTGGSVYRGSRIPDLKGIYVYADFCAGRLIGLRRAGQTIAESRDLDTSVPSIAGIVEGPDHELYVMSLGGPIMRLDPA